MPRHGRSQSGMSELVKTNNLADRLDAWSVWTTWTVLATGGLVLISADHLFPAVGMGPLFIPLIALAGWRLGVRASCFVTVLGCLLNIFPHHVHEVGLNPDVAIARGSSVSARTASPSRSFTRCGAPTTASASVPRTMR